MVYIVPMVAGFRGQVVSMRPGICPMWAGLATMQPMKRTLAYLFEGLRVQLGAGAANLALVVDVVLILYFVTGQRFLVITAISDFIHLLLIANLLVLPFVALSRYRLVWAAWFLPGLLALGVWYGPHFLPKFPPAPPDDTLSVIAYNSSGVGLEAGSAGLDGAREVYGAFEAEADIVGVQEFANHRLLALETLYPHIVEAHGLAILSRLPIEESQILYRGTNRDAQALVALRAVVVVGAERVNVYSFHPQRPTISVRPLVYDPTMRGLQTRAMAEVLADDDGPVIVMCDCNTGERSADYGQLAAHLRDSWRTGGWGWGFTAPDNNALPALIRSDYVWHSDHWQVHEAQVLEIGRSDHKPVLVQMSLQQ